MCLKTSENIEIIQNMKNTKNGKGRYIRSRGTKVYGQERHTKYLFLKTYSIFFSSAVPSGSGAFQMPTRPLSSLTAASTLKGGGGAISETPK